MWKASNVKYVECQNTFSKRRDHILDMGVIFWQYKENYDCLKLELKEIFGSLIF